MRFINWANIAVLPTFFAAIIVIFPPREAAADTPVIVPDQADLAECCTYAAFYREFHYQQCYKVCNKKFGRRFEIHSQQCVYGCVNRYLDQRRFYLLFDLCVVDRHGGSRDATVDHQGEQCAAVNS